MIVYRVILFSVSVIPFLPNCLFSCYNHSFCLRPELTFFCSTFPLKVSCLLSLDSSLFLSVNQLALLHLSIAQDQDQQLSCSLFSLQADISWVIHKSAGKQPETLFHCFSIPSVAQKCHWAGTYARDQHKRNSAKGSSRFWGFFPMRKAIKSAFGKEESVIAADMTVK